MTDPTADKRPGAKRGRVLIPLGAKIACLVAGLAALVIGGFAWISAQRTRLMIETELDARGSETARILAQSMPRVIDEERGRRLSVMFDWPPEDPTGEWAFRRQEERKAWKRRFEEFCRGGGLLNVAVVEDGVPTLDAHAPGQFEFAGRGERDGVCRVGPVAVPARRFREPIVSVDGTKTFGTVDVYLSLQALEQARRRILESVALLGGAAVILSIGLSLVIGGTLSRPLRRLAQDMGIVRTGNFAHRTKVATRDEIGLLADAFNEMTSGLQQAELVRQESERMKHDMQLAREIQERLLPAELPKIPRFDVAACYEPALEVSGDYYDVFPLPDGRFAIVVGDVSGKGISAGLVMTMTRSLIRMGAESGTPPVSLLRQVNGVLFRDLKRGTFVTLAYIALDARGGTLTMASGGHNPPCLWVPGHGECRDLLASGIALGVAEPKVFAKHADEVTMQLPVGGRLIVYTDGVTEAKDPENNDYGVERLHDLVMSRREMESRAFLNGLLEDIRSHRRGAEPSDDITVVALRRLG